MRGLFGGRKRAGGLGGISEDINDTRSPIILHSDGKPAETEQEESERRLEESLLAKAQKPHRNTRKQKPEWYGKHPLEWVIVFFTIIAAGAAIAAAVYTGREVVTMRDQEQRQLRAYLAIDGKFDDGDVGIDIRKYSPGSPIEVWAQIQNTGDTPAYHYDVYMDEELSPDPNVCQNSMKARMVAVDSTLQRHTFMDVSQVSNFTLTRDDVLNVGFNTIMLYVWGTVTYDDAFGFHHYTNFCQSASGPIGLQSESGIHNDSD
jgi:hypothetical protein